MSAAPVFIRSLTLVRRSVTVSAMDLTPLESFQITNRNRASPLSLIDVGESMRKSKPTGQQKESAGKKTDWKALEIVHPDAAGIDVGGSEHWVAISPGRDPEPVRRFGCFTADLREMAKWLIDKACEAWHAIDGRVLDAGIGSAGATRSGSILVNARHTKNLPGARVMCRSVNGC